MADRKTTEKKQQRPAEQITRELCRECGCGIGTGGLCSYGCQRDADTGRGRPKIIAYYTLTKTEEKD